MKQVNASFMVYDYPDSWPGWSGPLTLEVEGLEMILSPSYDTLHMNHFRSLHTETNHIEYLSPKPSYRLFDSLGNQKSGYLELYIEWPTNVIIRR